MKQNNINIPNHNLFQCYELNSYVKDMFKDDVTLHFVDKRDNQIYTNIDSDFLKNTYYAPNHAINTKERSDLVIHTGNKTTSPAGVIIEVKRPGISADMCTLNKINFLIFNYLVKFGNSFRTRITVNS
jgi:hypothetical protein